MSNSFMMLMLVFYIGLVPTVLSIIWVKYASNHLTAGHNSNRM